MLSLCHFQTLVFLLFAFLIFSAESRKTQLMNDNDIDESSNNGVEGTRWAVLVAGSNDYVNYRHQADICHAYQILRKGGLKDENIIVFMYDDIAFNPQNPRPGVIINKPDGEDVYAGVPKDYTGKAVNAKNLFNVLLGNETGVTGGSGKVLKSGPNDNVFIYYTDHGAPGIIGMPNDGIVYAKSLNKVLKKMHQRKSYKKMVIYLEACESGTVFQGLLKDNLNIYAVTSANTKESSWGAYCPGHYPSPGSEYEVCLGDVFSISWLEDSDLHDMSKETLKQQYLVTKRRTGMDQRHTSSHVSHFGSKEMFNDYLVSYIGTIPENRNFTFSEVTSSPISEFDSGLVNSRDIPLLYLQRKIQKAPMGSPERQEAEKELSVEMNHRKQIDQRITEILRLSTKQTNVLNLLTSTRTAGQPLVDDWDCFRTLVNSFQNNCGAKVNYGLKYTGALANICNMGVDIKQTVSVIEQACSIR